jgi:hypothetical protein
MASDPDHSTARQRDASAVQATAEPAASHVTQVTGRVE